MPCLLSSNAFFGYRNYLHGLLWPVYMWWVCPCLHSYKQKGRSVRILQVRINGRQGNGQPTQRQSGENDVEAIDNLAAKHINGEYGLPKNEVMALRLYLRAVELGKLSSIVSLAKYFYNGDVHVPQDAVFARQFA